ncbi:MAG TPA: type II CAAX endopeptidase family protein [Vicinamibacterales bacterium]|nr:type II CAAX endopeptidase family protein [Vicinamibacterales bacterium]
MGSVLQAVALGMFVMLAGTIPRNILFAANLRYQTGVPWAVPLTAAYLCGFWWYLRGGGPPRSTSDIRRDRLRANRVPGRVWTWALLAGGLGIVALVLVLRVANRMVSLPPQTLPDLSQVPTFTVWGLLLMAAPVAGIVEEAAFRGYMQGPIERRYGLTVAILITGTMFAVAHLDFTLILWPYYVAVAALYGTVTYLTNSIWPAVVLHTGGNIYSNIDLLLHGRADWQAPSRDAALVWATGVDTAFVRLAIALLVAAAGMLWAYANLADEARTCGEPLTIWRNPR